jgi:hypothetical protein
MGIRKSLGTRVCGGGVLAASAVLASAGIALASNPIDNGHYSGHYQGRPTDSITFTVSATGKKVIDIDVSTPFKCNGGCGGVESGIGGTARIHKNKFTAKIKLHAPGTTNTLEGRDTVTGRFLKHFKAKGTVTSHFLHGGSGETVHWTATVSGG